MGAEETAAFAEGDSPSSLVPAAPPAHLTARNIVYEVDIDPPADEETKESEESLLEAEADDDSDSESSVGNLITAREFGQTGKGALAEYVLERQLGKSALRASSHMSSTRSKPGDVHADEMEPPAPGRLRLLSGITASFEPGTLNALMGESGAGSKFT